MLEGNLAHLAHRGGDARGDHKVVGLVLLQHQPHGLDIVAGKAPVALGIDVAQAQFLLFSLLDPGSGVGDFAGHEFDPAQRRLVIEQDAAAGMQVETLAVVHGDPVAIKLGDTVRAARIEGGIFVLLFGLDQAKHFTGRGLVETGVRAELTDGFEQMGHTQAIDDPGGHGLTPGGRDKALCRQVVDLVRC
ncbi:hypothetical protein D3C72_1791300 [compost metagenome]